MATDKNPSTKQAEKKDSSRGNRDPNTDRNDKVGREKQTRTVQGGGGGSSSGGGGKKRNG